MPLPSKQKDETPGEFIDRCMADPITNREYPNTKQRYAVCQSLKERAKKRKAAKGEEGEPTWDDAFINDVLL